MVDAKNQLSQQRLMCLEVYRGLMVAGMILVDNPGSDEHACWPIMHAKWNGWTPADFIFPSFLFLVGISMVYSFAARRQRVTGHWLRNQKNTRKLIGWMVLFAAIPFLSMLPAILPFRGRTPICASILPVVATSLLDLSEGAVVSWSWGGISSLFASARDPRIYALMEMTAACATTLAS